MAYRFLGLSPNRSLGRLTRTVKNIWTKSEMRRTSQPGSMMKPAARSPRQLARKVVGVLKKDGKMWGDKRFTSYSTINPRKKKKKTHSRLRTPLLSAAR